MTPKQNVIFFLLLTLLVVHGIMTGQFAALWTGAFQSSSAKGGQSGWNPFTGIL